jgi:hypothetical protein
MEEAKENQTDDYEFQTNDDRLTGYWPIKRSF